VDEVPSPEELPASHRPKQPKFQGTVRKGKDLLAQAVAELFDQRSAMGRLATVQVLSIMGDAMVTVSLAGSLFFSISPDEARSKILLYLVLTMAPFAVVAPLLGPMLDRGKGARRLLVLASTAGRGVLVFFMAMDLKSLLLFPEAFCLLVLSKLYMVAKSALVPGAVGEGDQLASANARLALLSSIAGAMGSVPAVVIYKIVGAPWVLRADLIVYGAASLAVTRLAGPRKYLRGGDKRSAGPPGSPSSRGEDLPSEQLSDEQVEELVMDPIPGEGLVAGHFLPPSAAGVTLAATVIAILRGSAGFLTFLLAFQLRREHASLLWYGLALVATAVGSMAGSLIVPRLRRKLSEPAILVAASMGVAVVAAAAALAGGEDGIEVLLALAMGLAFATAKPSFDALVQRYVPRAAQGKAFARFETRFQLLWVFGALLPSVTVIPFVPGDIVIAAVAAIAMVSYVTSRRALRQARQQGSSGP
jgi:hypothetical protein